MDSPDRRLRLDSQFEHQAQRTPNRVALYQGERSVTFAELQERSDRLARTLAAKGIPSGAFIGLHMDRSIEYVISILAILKSNSAVVPLPPSYPDARLQDILSFSALDAVIDDGLTPLRPFPGTRIIHVADCLAASETSGSSTIGSPDSPAFVLCSSGSTGRPKMIVRSHRSFFHRLHWTWQHHPYGPEEVCCQKSHMTTTHAIYELFEPLLRGIPVHIISDQEVRSLESFWDKITALGITRLLIVPTTLQASLDIPGFRPPPLRVLVLMGEYVPSPLAGRIIETFPVQTQLFSIYGSTEASSTLLCDLRASFRPGEELPLGAPISPEVLALVLDAQLHRVPPGDVGTLHLAGPPLFAGYFKDPALTALALVTSPEVREPLYDSHDQVRLMPNGDLRFVGRVDHTVKIRGFRVDLQEVEHAIHRHQGVTQCVVIPSTDDSAQSVLLAFVAPASFDQASLLDALRAELPAYMVPSVVLGLSAFPLTPSGKIDRQRLIEEHRHRRSSRSALVPRSDTEQRVFEVWRDVLRHTDIPPGASFFEVGGTSLTVFATVHRLRTAFALERSQLSDLSVYQHPTIESLASYIEGLGDGTSAPAAAVASGSILVSLKRGDDPSLSPLFVISSAGGTVGAYDRVVRTLKTDRAVVGVRDPFIWGDRDPTLGFRHWVARFVDAIRERQPTGPYYLAAYSSAGAFGYEIARRLREAGEAVAMLALIDPLAMDRATEWRYGYWALEARFMRRPLRWLVLFAGWMRMALPGIGRSERGEGLAPSLDQFREAAAAATTPTRITFAASRRCLNSTQVFPSP